MKRGDTRKQRSTGKIIDERRLQINVQMMSNAVIKRCLLRNKTYTLEDEVDECAVWIQSIKNDSKIGTLMYNSYND